MLHKRSRILAFLLILVLTVSFFPLVLTVQADTTGSGTAEDPYLVDNWNDLKTAMSAGGYMKLTANVTDPAKTSGESQLDVPGGVTVDLDLNGFTIDRGLTSNLRYGYVICVGGGATLNIRDSVGGGKITGGYERKYSWDDLNGGGLCVMGGTVNLYGGEISGNKAVNGGYGGGIFVLGGTLNMYGGSIKDNYANTSGGVSLKNSIFTLYDGEISGNRASNDYYGGGVAVLEGSTFIMNGGKISGNKARLGGGVCVNGSSSPYPSFTMNGGEITGNTAEDAEHSGGEGGGVFVAFHCSFTMTGGSITENTANYNSYISSAPTGGGIYVSGSCLISGKVIIQNNQVENTYQYATRPTVVSNFGIDNDNTTQIRLSGALTEDSTIGVSLRKVPATENPTVFLTGDGTYIPTEEDISRFFSDGNRYEIHTSDAGEATMIPHTSGEAVKENEITATCTAGGSYDEVVYCTSCGIELSRTKKETPPLGHTYDTIVISPTCTEKGYSTYGCTVCGALYEDSDEFKWNYTDALGHDYNTVVTSPGCTEGGYTTHTCSRCGDSYVDTETDALGHNYDAVVTPPTYTEAGFTTYTCSRCGDSYTGDAVAALVHYDVTENANAEWKKASGGHLSITSAADITKFVSVIVNDAVIDPSNYTAESGGTKISLKQEYLETLPVGTYTLTIVSTDGDATTQFTIRAADIPAPDPESAPKKNNLLIVWIVVPSALVLAGVVAIVIVKKKKKA